MTTDQDTGDENDGTRSDTPCPFCGCNLDFERRWSTAIMEPMEMSFAEAAMITPSSTIGCEALVTCRAPSCMAEAKAFAAEYRLSRAEKTSRAHLIGLRRRAGEINRNKHATADRYPCFK